MFLKKIPLIIITILIFVSPISVNAQSISLIEQQGKLQLLFQIQELLKVVSELQLKLESINNSELPAEKINYTKKLYQSKFFFFPYQAIYFVEDLQLINSDNSRMVRNKDQELFNLFVAVVGEEEIEKHIREWRIFDDENTDTGAYVESMNGMKDWTVGVNESGFRINDINVSKSFANLFIHEYAHIILATKTDFIQNFTDKFWTSADFEHQSKLTKVKSEDRFRLTNSYYRKNINQFASDYATVSPDEDMAETFIYFVIEDKPKNNTIRNQKILFLYQEPELVKIRMEIRANLKTLNL